MLGGYLPVKDIFLTETGSPLICFILLDLSCINLISEESSRS
jgi:hypothetical protein